MKLTILGSGTAAPLLNKNCAGYLLEIGNNKLLFDTGAGTIRRLLELKFDLFSINNIFYPQILKINVKKQCQKEFKGNIVLAEDKIRINI